MSPGFAGFCLRFTAELSADFTASCQQSHLVRSERLGPLRFRAKKRWPLNELGPVTSSLVMPIDLARSRGSRLD